MLTTNLLSYVLSLADLPCRRLCLILFQLVFSLSSILSLAFVPNALPQWQTNCYFDDLTLYTDLQHRVAQVDGNGYADCILFERSSR